MKFLKLKGIKNSKTGNIPTRKEKCGLSLLCTVILILIVYFPKSRIAFEPLLEYKIDFGEFGNDGDRK